MSSRGDCGEGDLAVPIGADTRQTVGGGRRN